jgi:hypothetical protein
MREQPHRLDLARGQLVRAPRSRSAFVMTDAEERLMASAAIMGDKSHPVNG